MFFLICIDETKKIFSFASTICQCKWQKLDFWKQECSKLERKLAWTDDFKSPVPNLTKLQVSDSVACSCS